MLNRLLHDESAIICSGERTLLGGFVVAVFWLGMTWLA